MRSYIGVQAWCLLGWIALSLCVVGCDGSGGKSLEPKSTLAPPYMIISGLPDPVEPAENIEEVGKNQYDVTLGFNIGGGGIAPLTGQARFTRVSPTLVIYVPLTSIYFGDNLLTLTGLTLPPGQWICRIDVQDGIPQNAYYRFPLAIRVPLPYLKETCDGYGEWADALNGPNHWRRGKTDEISSTNWYVGSEFPSPPVRMWAGPMFHCNNGPDGSNGDAPYQWGGANRWWSLVSNEILVPLDVKQLDPLQVHPYLFFRVRMELNYYGMTLLRAGWTTNGSSTSTDFNQYAQVATTYWSFDKSIPAYVWSQNRIVRVDCGAMVGQKAYIKFMARSSTWTGPGSGATGWHLDGIHLLHGDSPPAGI